MRKIIQKIVEDAFNPDKMAEALKEQIEDSINYEAIAEYLAAPYEDDILEAARDAAEEFLPLCNYL